MKINFSLLIITFIGIKILSIDTQESLLERSLLGITFKANGLVIDILFLSITIR